MAQGDFHFWFKTAGPGVRTVGGVNYDPLQYGYSDFNNALVTTRQVTANFGNGDVSGTVTQFMIVPEPGTLTTVGLGILTLLARAWLQRRGRGSRADGE